MCVCVSVRGEVRETGVGGWKPRQVVDLPVCLNHNMLMHARRCVFAWARVHGRWRVTTVLLSAAQLSEAILDTHLFIKLNYSMNTHSS